MTRRLWFAALSGTVLWAQTSQQPAQQSGQQPTQSTPPAQEVPDENSLPEEDESVAPEKFVLNPLESERSVRIGNYYWHKGNMRAALRRYEWATKYNPSSAEAFYKVGEAEDKLKDKDKARLAYKRVVDIAPDSKLGREAKKKLSKNG